MIQARHLHHDFPCVHRQVSVIERPVELFPSNRLVGGVVIRCQVLMFQRFSCTNAFLRVEHQHTLEEVHGCRKLARIEGG